MGLKEVANHAEESEKAIEAYLATQAVLLGGRTLKYSNPNVVGYPDRIVILPGKPAVWVEVKSKGKKPRAIQRLRHETLRNLGQSVYVVDSKEAVDQVMKEIQEM